MWVVSESASEEMMRISTIICSRNRAAQLKVSLSKIDLDSLARHNIQLLLVDSASEDQTLSTMQTFAAQLPGCIQVLRAARPGLSVARNAGVRAATGDLLTFTDDDCYLDKNYYPALLEDFDPVQFQYGMGQAILFDQSDDRRIANHTFEGKLIIPPGALLHPGTIQGLNMFALRKVFESIGLFSEDFGLGTRFPIEDLEFAMRASLAGFSGVLLPSVIIYHHHGIKPGSPRAEATVNGYATARGAYYASLMARGVNAVWQLWSSRSTVEGNMHPALAARLEREFRGAADYLNLIYATTSTHHLSDNSTVTGHG
jgi:GT2 family glycosyltransferase